MEHAADDLLKVIRRLRSTKKREKLLALRWACSLYIQEVDEPKLQADLAGAWKKVHVMYERGR
jgi:hypothetical protein